MTVTADPTRDDDTCRFHLPYPPDVFTEKLIQTWAAYNVEIGG